MESDDKWHKPQFHGGKLIYRKSISIFGEQGKYAQLPYDFDYDSFRRVTLHKPKKLKRDDKKDKKEKHLIDRYLNDGYDPRLIYEPEEYEYKEAVQILTPIDIEFGVLPKSSLKTKNKMYSPIESKNDNSIEHLVTKSNKVKLTKSRYNIEKVNKQWCMKYDCDECYSSKKRRVWFSDNPYYDD